jgi:hypothetical protein
MPHRGDEICRTQAVSRVKVTLSAGTKNTRQVHNGPCAIDEPGEALGVIQRTRHPLDGRAGDPTRIVEVSNQNPRFDTGRTQGFDQMGTDKSGPARDRDRLREGIEPVLHLFGRNERIGE